MNIVIVDARKGNRLGAAKDAINERTLLLIIEPDNHVRVVPGESLDHRKQRKVTFFEGVTEAQASADKAEQHLAQREVKREDEASEDAMTKATRVWKGDAKDHPGWD